MTLKAKSSPAKHVYGYLLVKLDGAIVDSIYVAGEDKKSYTRLLHPSAGDHWLSFEFINDSTNGAEDRNIWIDEIILEFFKK